MKLCAFDLDGTLIDSRLDIARAANAARRSVGLNDAPVEELVKLVGHGARSLVAGAIAPSLRVDEALAAWRDDYGARLLDTTKAYEGLDVLLEQLKAAGVTLAVATNKPGGFARTICRALFPGVFELVIGGDEAERKPSPEMLQRIGAKTGVSADRSVYVGDMPVDEQTARAAKWQFVGVGWGFAGAPPAGAVLTVPELRAELSRRLRGPA